MGFVVRYEDGSTAIWHEESRMRLKDGYIVISSQEIPLTLEALLQLQSVNPFALQDYVEWCQGVHNELSSSTVLLILGRHLLMNRGNTLWVSEDIKRITACAGDRDGKLKNPITGESLNFTISSEGDAVHHLNRV